MKTFSKFNLAGLIHHGWWGVLGRSTFYTAALLAVGCAPGGDPGLAERLEEARAKTYALEGEAATLRKRIAELEARPEPVAKPPSLPSPSAPHIKPLKEVRDDFDKEALAYRSKLVAELDAFSLDGITLQGVDASGIEQAYRTTVILRLADKSGGPKRELEIPVFADVTGRWNFPDVAGIEKSASELSPSTTQVGGAGAEVLPNVNPPSGTPTVISPFPGSNNDVIVRWAGTPSTRPDTGTGPSAPSQPPQSQPPSPANPPEEAVPAAARPSDKDIKIEF